MSDLYAGSECCGAPLVTVGEHDTVDGKHVIIDVCSECGKEYQFVRWRRPMTDRKQRNITPGKGDISTFLDCEDRDPYKPKLSFCTSKRGGCVFCETNLEYHECPRGYAR